MSELHFITISSNPRLALRDAESRRLIRTAATKATRSPKVHELSRKHYARSNVIQTTVLRAHVSRFRVRQTDEYSTGKRTTTESSVAIPSVDIQPSIWDPVVTPLGDQAWLLLHYYRYLFRSRSWAINAKRDWFAFVIEDQAATHATLAFVSLNRDLEEGSKTSVTTFHHRARAIYLVRQRLASPTAHIEDSLIGAVALLSITEGLEGRSSSSRLHVRALQKLVDLRGGFKNLHKNEALSRLVAWADLCHTSTFSSMPHLPKLFHYSDLNLGIDGVAPQNTNASTFQKAVQGVMSPEIYELVRLLAAIPQYPPTDQTSVEVRQNTSRLIYHINQLVLSIYHNRPDFRSDPVSRLAKVLCNATYLYISLVLRQMPKRTKVVVERAQNLRISIRETEDYSLSELASQEFYALIILWARTVHFCSLLPRDQTGAIVACVKTAAKALQINNIEELEERLGQISWVNGCAMNELGLLFKEANYRS